MAKGKSLKMELAALGECLAVGAVIFPNLMFVGLIWNHNGAPEYCLPFILVYAFEKCGVFAIQGMGKLSNPLRVAKDGLILSIVGAVLCILGMQISLVWAVGGILIGLGLANFSAMFRTVRDQLRVAGTWPKGPTIILGYIFFCVFVIATILLRHGSTWMVAVMFAALQSATLIYLYKLDTTKASWTEKPAFVKGTRQPVQLIPALCILLLTFSVRWLKQTANLKPVLFIFCIAVIFGIASSLYIKRDSNHSLHRESRLAMWFGAMRNFLIIFSLIGYSALGAYDLVTICYLAIGLGSAIALPLKRSLLHRCSQTNTEKIVVFGSLVSLIPLVFDTTYIVSVLCCSAFVATGSSLVLSDYLQDEDFPPFERRLVRSRLSATGALLQQLALLVTLGLCSFFLTGTGDTTISTYAYATGSIALSEPVFATKVIMVVILALTGTLLYKKQCSIR